MADFVAVLRKTIGSLSDNTPEMREKVFDKARSTIEARLKAIEPPPPAAVIERQRKALEDAIATLRADYAEPVVSPESERDNALESVLAALDEQPPALQSSSIATPPAIASAALPISATVAPPVAASATAPPATPLQAPQPAKPAPSYLDTSAGERLAGDIRPAARPISGAAPEGRRSTGGLIAALIVVLAAAGGGYYWWNSSSDISAPVAQAPIIDSEAGQQAETDSTVALPDTTPPADQMAESETASETQTADNSQPESVSQAADKFTQRLLPDGSEIDDGPAGGEPGIGEGSSVAASAQPSESQEVASALASETSSQSTLADSGADQATDATNGPPAAAEEAQPAEPATTPDNSQQPAAVTVGQRAIFYEERTSTADGAAEMGSIAWSLVQESPGGDLPPEAAIRAEATIPGKDVQLRMTIRRNGDQTLPASHIVEMIFLTPDGFGGGGVSSVSRIAFKETEQAAGSPLIGIPAKIADGFFLIALSDAPAEIQANLNLLARQSWIDIPLVYQSGQRALLSVEKGIPGERVFQEALQAWEAAGSN